MYGDLPDSAFSCIFLPQSGHPFCGVMDFAEGFCTGTGICVYSRRRSCGVCIPGDFLERVYTLVHDGGGSGFGCAAVLDPGASGQSAVVCTVSAGDARDYACGILYRMCCESLVEAGGLGLLGNAVESHGADLSDIFCDVVSALHTGILALRTDSGKAERKIRCEK